VLAVVLMAAFALCVDARGRSDAEVAMDIATEIGASAKAVSRINRVVDQLRAAVGTHVQGYFCQTIYATDNHQFPFSNQFMSSKYGSWVPTGSKSVSIFLQAEASAKAFVGISAGVGMGLDITIATGTGTGATGKVVLFACLGASISVGYIGATASAGGGVLVGFGTFKESIMKANMEVGAEVAALGSGGVGVLLNVEGPIQAFQTQWKKWMSDKMKTMEAAPGPKKTKQEVVYDMLKTVAKAGGKLATGAVAMVKGVHISGGVGVGGGIGGSAEVDLDVITKGIKSGFDSIWSSKAGQWLKGTKVWGAMKNKLSGIGQSKFGQKWQEWKSKIGNVLKSAADKSEDFFDYAPLKEKE